MGSMRSLVSVISKALVVMIAIVCGRAAADKPQAAPATVVKPQPAPQLAQPIERRLHSDDIDASSFLWNDWNKFVENYHPNYVADDDPATAWVEGAKGTGGGEWLRIQITPLEATTRVRLHLRNGYQKSPALFKANARAKAVTLRLLPSKVEKQVALADSEGWQDIVVDQPSGVVRTVELAVRSVYDGSKYEDLCISDVQVFATSSTPDNPAFEKSKYQTLKAWRAARLAAAKAFRGKAGYLPLYPAYEVVTTDAEIEGYGAIEQMIESAQKDPVFRKEWQGALALAEQVVDEFDELRRAQVAPASRDKLVESDGLQILEVRSIVGDEGFYGGYDRGALRLPLLDYVSTLFADQLRVLDVKDKLTVDDFLRERKRCAADVTWVSRAAASDGKPARVQGLVIGRCAKVSTRDGTFWGHAIELYIYDAAGRIALSIAQGHIDGYRWSDVDGKPMLAGGRALLATGAVIEARRRDAVAAN